MDRITNATRAKLERIGDEIEAIARFEFENDDPARKELFARAWDIKQIARRGTPSEGI